MATPTPIVAIDLGATKVACVVATPKVDGPGMEILGSSLMPYPRPVQSWPHDPLLIGRTIEQALEATGAPYDAIDAHVAFSHPALKAENTTASITLADEPITVREQDLQRLARVALTQALGVDREALIVERLGCDGNGFQGVRDPKGLVATRLVGTFHIITIPISVRRAIVQAVESAGLEVAQLTYSLLAGALAGEQTREAHRLLLIDVGGLSIDVGLLVDGQLRASTVVPWGGLTLASTLAKQLKLTVEQATTLSLEGLGSRRPEVREALEKNLKYLQKAIHKVLEDAPRPDRVVVTGRGALIDGMMEWCERTTEVNTVISRSARLQEMGTLSRQVGLSTAMGIIEQVGAKSPVHLSQPGRLFDRLLLRTKTLLSEYF